MPITVIVCSEGGVEARLTFDGMQRVVIGRGPGSDVRLPDAGVSHRHACLVARGAEFLLVDEGSTNGTFVGDVRVAPHTSRAVRSGDAVRIGRVRLELRVDQGPVTRDVAGATRDLALALLSQAMAARGQNLTARICVVEGNDRGASLVLADEGRAYVLGRGPDCDLPLSDADASREHARVERQGNTVVVRDLGAKNGTWLGETRAPMDRDVAWRPAQMMRIGRTVLGLVEPLGDALAQIESAPDEELPPFEAVEPPSEIRPSPTSLPAGSRLDVAGVERDEASVAPLAPAPSLPAPAVAQRRTRFSIADLAVMATAVCILALSIAGLLWLLHG